MPTVSMPPASGPPYGCFPLPPHPQQQQDGFLNAEGAAAPSAADAAAAAAAAAAAVFGDGAVEGAAGETARMWQS